MVTALFPTILDSHKSLDAEVLPSRALHGLFTTRQLYKAY